MDATRARRLGIAGTLCAVAVTGCGGSRLSHDAILSAANGGPVDEPSSTMAL